MADYQETKNQHERLSKPSSRESSSYVSQAPSFHRRASSFRWAPVFEPTSSPRLSPSSASMRRPSFIQHGRSGSDALTASDIASRDELFDAQMEAETDDGSLDDPTHGPHGTHSSHGPTGVSNQWTKDDEKRGGGYDEEQVKAWRSTILSKPSTRSPSSPPSGVSSYESYESETDRAEQVHHVRKAAQSLSRLPSRPVRASPSDRTSRVSPSPSRRTTLAPLAPLTPLRPLTAPPAGRTLSSRSGTPRTYSKEFPLSPWV